MGDLSKRLAALSAEKQALLLKRLKESNAGSKLAKIPRQGREQDTFPLSFAQQRRWFLSQLEPESSAYNVWHIIEIKRGVSLPAIRETLAELVRRHEVLRTIYPTVNGEPVQKILPPSEPLLTVIDLREVRRSERKGEISRILALETGRPFDLIHGPVLRTTLLRYNDYKDVLFLIMDHILVDGWSYQILLNEFEALYMAFGLRQPPQLEELDIQYADFAVWQREHLQGERYQQLMDYWKRQLEGAPKLLELPTDRPRPAVQSYNGASLSFAVDKNLSESLRSLSRGEGVTLYMTLLAAFCTLLYRYGGQKTICVGTPIANRNRPEIEKLIGCFVNTLVMRIDLHGDMTFRQLVKAVQQVTLGAYAHQDMPFERLVDEIKFDRNLSHSPLFQVMFGLQNVPGNKTYGLSQNITRVEGMLSTSKFDLELAAVESYAGEIGCGLQYNTDLFDDWRMIQLVRHFQNLLKAVAATPDTRLADITLLSEREREQLLVKWNASAQACPKGRCTHELISWQVRQTPEKIAVVCGDQQLTYEEMEAQSDRAAARLIEYGIGAEDVVALLADRSIDFLILILAVFKTGAAYLPLDPRHPLKRIVQVLQQSRARCLIVSNKYRSRLSPSTENSAWPFDENVIEVEELISASVSQKPLSVRVGLRNLCYVIYTSGSTGIPKGAMIEHAGMLNHLYAKIKDLRLTGEDIVAQTASQCFDISVWQYLAALINGGQVYIINDEEAQDPGELARQVEQGGITVLETVPSLLRAMMQEVSASEAFKARLSGLTWMMVTGEALPPDLADDWLRTYPEVGLMNAYGPTECSDDVTHYVVGEMPFERITYMPIGRPIINTEIYILDKYQMPVPTGVDGEVYVGGAGVGRGYLNEASQTAEVFVPDHLSLREGARLYRTGDKGRFKEDGNVLYIGRKDNQVKVRGYRIELGEIESVMLQHAAISDIAVLVREVGGEKTIIAYFVAEPAVQIGEGDLKAFAREKLPGYMVPSFFIGLEAMPLTANGKIDRNAFPELPDFLQTSSRYYVAPRTATEEVMAGIWMEILRLPRVSVYDDFFELGGHSLMATQVISRVRKVFECDLRLVTLFERPMVADLSEFIDAQMRRGHRAQSQPIRPIPRNEELQASYAQLRQWFLEQMDPGTGTYNIPVARRLDAKLDLAALSRALTELVRRHEILRMVFPAVDGKPVPILRAADAGYLNIIDLSSLDVQSRESEAQRLVVSEAWQPFDLAVGPLSRVALIELSEEQHVLLLTMHHIITDGWSIGILIDDLTTLYGAYASGRPSPLPELAIQYADYAAWQHAMVRSGAMADDIAYWKNRLTGAPALELPTDRPRPLARSYRGGREGVFLGSPLSQQITALSRAEGVTVFMILLAAWQALLSRYSGQEDISVGSQNGNRNHPELEGLIGFFVNHLDFRTVLSGNLSFRTLLGQVRQLALEAYTHQDLPFEVVLEAVNPVRDPSRAPLFQVMFTLQNFPESKSVFKEVAVAPLSEEVAVGGVHTATFDLTLLLIEGSLGLAGTLDYATDLYDAGTIRRMIKHFSTMLAGALENLDQPLGALSLLSPEERQQLLIEQNRDRQSQMPNHCLTELFEKQASEHPEAVALVAEESCLSYGELNARANRVARRLWRVGAGIEKRVATLLEDAANMVIAHLGIWKAGAVCVPLAPECPAERLQAMLENASASVLLIHHRRMETLPTAGQANLQIIPMDFDGDDWHCESSDNLSFRAQPDHLACLIYNRSSHGLPAALMIPHRGLANPAPARHDEHEATAEARSGCHSASWIDEYALAIALIRQLAIAGEPAAAPQSDCSARRTELGIYEQKACPAPPAVVSAGSLEAIEAQASPEESLPFTGGADTEVYVLDGYLQPSAVGAVGEVFIGGPGLARGYDNAPDLTAAIFLPHPLTAASGARLYRTGIMGRLLPGGKCKILGRREDQLTVGGLRVNLKEVERVFSRHPAVLAASVIGAEDATGRVRLIARVVPASTATPSVRELRRFGKKYLPAYMLPAQFILAKELPAISEAQLDRRPLPAPLPCGMPDGYVAPESAVEEGLQKIWQEVLEQTEIGVFDNFFALGGRSLLATQVVSRIRKDFKVEITLRSVFESPTIADLASTIEEALSSDR